MIQLFDRNGNQIEIERTSFIRFIDEGMVSKTKALFYFFSIINNSANKSGDLGSKYTFTYIQFTKIIIILFRLLRYYFVHFYWIYRYLQLQLFLIHVSGTITMSVNRNMFHTVSLKIMILIMVIRSFPYFNRNSSSLIHSGTNVRKPIQHIPFTK